MSMPPALGIGAARARASGDPDRHRVGCAGPAAPWGHRHRDSMPAENRCFRFIPGAGVGGLQGRGSSGGDGFAGHQVGGLQLGAKSSLGREWRVRSFVGATAPQGRC